MGGEAGDGAGRPGRALYEGPCEGVGLSQNCRKRNVFCVFDTGVKVVNGPKGGIEAGGRWPVWK